MKVICVKIKNCLERVLFQLDSAVAIGSWYPKELLRFAVFLKHVLHGAVGTHIHIQWLVQTVCSLIRLEISGNCMLNFYRNHIL